MDQALQVLRGNMDSDEAVPDPVGGDLSSFVTNQLDFATFGKDHV